jgi:hypothetical protein
LNPALFVAHPGHELRLHRWLELSHPDVYVLTDGSGSAGYSRVPSTLAVLDATGARAGSVMGEVTDHEIYQAVMHRDVVAAVSITLRLAAAFVDADFVVVDSWEGYNPTHDLCRVMGALATARATCLAGRTVPLYEYLVVQPFRSRGSADEIVVSLDEEALSRKLSAAHRYKGLRVDVEQMLERMDAEALRIEVIRPAEAPVISSKPFYEARGEQQVAAGRYPSVLRYTEHLAPFLAALTEAVHDAPLPASAAGVELARERE